MNNWEYDIGRIRHQLKNVPEKISDHIEHHLLSLEVEYEAECAKRGELENWIKEVANIVEHSLYTKERAKSAKLIEEIACLRSVLSEREQDKACFTQWIRAEELAQSKNITDAQPESAQPNQP